MNGISNVQGADAYFSRQQTDRTQNNRFENALAAARTVESKTTRSDTEQPPIDQVDLASMLPEAKPQSVVPSKMIQSLNKLVQNNQAENYGGFDVKQ